MTDALRHEAADPRTPPSRLGQLAATSIELAVIVAGNPSTTPGMLTRLAGSPAREVREAVCVHPRTPPWVVFDRLALEMPEVFAGAALGQTFFDQARGRGPRTGVVRRLLAREELPLAWIEALVVHPYPSIRVALAERPGLVAGAVARLVGDPSPHVRRAVAGRPALDRAWIAALVADPDPRVRERIGGHAGLCAAEVAALVADPDAAVRRAVAGRPGLEDRFSEALATDKDPWVRVQLAGNPACPERLLRGFADAEDRWLDDALLSNPQTPPDVLRRVAPRVAGATNSEYFSHRWLVAHPRFTEDIVAEVLRRASPGLRSHLIHSARPLSIATMLGLAADPEGRPAFSLSFRSDVTAEVLWQLLAHPEPLARGGAVRHPRAPRALVERGAVDPSPWVRANVAEHPEVPPELLARLSRDPEPQVRAAVAKHSTDPALLARLASDASDSVLRAVAYNRHTPPELAGPLRERVRRWYW